MRRRLLLRSSQADICRATGINAVEYGLLEKEKKSPRAGGGWSINVQRLAQFYDCGSEDLFPSDVYEIPTRPQEVMLLDEITKISTSISPEHWLVYQELKERVREVLATLTPREEKVLRMRFGIGEKSDLTLDEICQEFEVHRSRIQQIEAKALHKLRYRSRLKHLEEYVDR